MSGFSTYQAQEFIALLRAETLYVALFTADPTDDNVTANEVSAGWYARQALGSLSAPVGTGVATSNNNQVTWNAVTDSSVTVTHIGLYDASSGGNLRYSEALDESKTYAVDDVPIIAANALTITFN